MALWAVVSALSAVAKDFKGLLVSILYHDMMTGQLTRFSAH